MATPVFTVLLKDIRSTEKRNTYLSVDRKRLAVESFSERLRRAMDRAGLDQASLARALGVRDATVSDWFKKEATPSGAVLMKMPAVLGVDGHWLLTGDGDMTKQEPSEDSTRLAMIRKALTAPLSELGDGVRQEGLMEAVEAIRPVPAKPPAKRKSGP